jgi:hypothetical protein
VAAKKVFRADKTQKSQSEFCVLSALFQSRRRSRRIRFTYHTFYMKLLNTTAQRAQRISYQSVVFFVPWYNTLFQTLTILLVNFAGLQRA